MRAYVYTDEELERYAGRFVWLSIDAEAARNEQFLRRYPIPVLPTILIIDTRHDAVALRYVGGATSAQLSQMLEDVESAHRGRTQTSSDTLLIRGDDLASSGHHLRAASAYADAIAAAPKQWRRFDRAAESLVTSLSLGDDFSRCTTRAVELYPRLEGTASGANIASTGLTCASRLKQDDARRASAMATLEKATRASLDDARIALSDDDRSGLYIALIDARDSEGDDEGAIELKAEWSAFLEGAAARAKNAQQRAVYDSHRLTAYLDLGIPEEAIPMLEQSAHDFPDDYNPPARMAIAYVAMKKYDEALAASDRALALVNGPRRLSVLSVRADIFIEKGDRKAARETLAQAIEYAKSLPASQRSEKRIKALEKRLAEMK